MPKPHFLLVPLALLALWAAPAAADLKADCIDSPTPEAGIAACTQRIETEDLDAEQLSLAYSNRAAWRWLMDDLDAADADATRAIGIDPDNWRAYLNRGRVRYDRGDNDAAIRDYDDALAGEPGDPADRSAVLIDRGNAHFRKADYDRALNDYFAARDLDEDVLVHRNIGVTYYEMGEYRQAIASHNRALAMDPDHFASITGRGEALEELGQFDAAMADYTRALDLDYDNWAPAVKRWMAARGYWDGPVDGPDSAEFRTALEACVRAPDC